ncbi:N(4)-(beta-N-acetylglucosaminyl)-L-asparaginase [Flavihumibacter solisilvae]|uniref:Glycosylasparaginase n=1 Tax=Flavihumibacter solisilvae TaxID=1349421 RepID=A0A0C1L139_9BACT|nr:N(4)-(beta-N-acetylglucosaminyl)-L-asparaginase [Flavihumibacter solisilvae]KIC93341.1 glycosylasparaginase [Flavihumibacter solisilvae]
MLQRRRFLQQSILSSLGFLVGKESLQAASGNRSGYGTKPIVVSTWAPNAKANAEAWKVLAAKGRALDAVEKGVHVTEADPADQSVGYGGLPDRDGKVTVDSCVMDEFGNCGAVMYLENILHPVSVARLVMEKTPHVQLVGNGALQFALSQGFTKTNLLTAESEKAWRNWLKTSKYDPMITVENIMERDKKEKKKPGQIHNHDTIGMIALDHNGNLSGACSTSGMAFKMNGRVGDSPIIGAGLYVDNEVGAATATGLGEEIVRICGSHTIIEMMRAGFSPEEACKKAVERIVKRNGLEKARNLQAGFIAINKQGEVGAYSVIKGFNYAVHTSEGPYTKDSKFLV